MLSPFYVSFRNKKKNLDILAGPLKKLKFLDAAYI
jgi:hypothetical protein